MLCPPEAWWGAWPAYDIYQLKTKETALYPFCVDFLEMHMEMDRLIDPLGSALGSGFHMQCTYVKVAAAFALPCTQSRNLAPLSITKLGLEHWAFLQHYGLVNARSAISTVTPRVFGTSQVIIFGFHVIPLGIGPFDQYCWSIAPVASCSVAEFEAALQLAIRRGTCGAATSLLTFAVLGEVK